MSAAVFAPASWESIWGCTDNYTWSMREDVKMFLVLPRTRWIINAVQCLSEAECLKRCCYFHGKTTWRKQAFPISPGAPAHLTGSPFLLCSVCLNALETLAPSLRNERTLQNVKQSRRFPDFWPCTGFFLFLPFPSAWLRQALGSLEIKGPVTRAKYDYYYLL